MSRKLRFNLMITRRQRAKMEKIEQEYGICFSEQVRRALDVWLTDMDKSIQDLTQERQEEKSLLEV